MNEVKPKSRDTETSPPQTTNERRGFLSSAAAITAAALGGLLGVGPLAIGLYATVMDPLRKKTTPQKAAGSAGATGAKEGYYFVAQIGELDSHVPRRFTIVADKIDAWNFMKDQPIGAVYMRMQGEQIECFHTTCPHAGCAVSYELESQAYLCPCHNSSFKVDGSKLEFSGSSNPSPRGLDALEVDVQGTNVFVKYEDYFTGRHDQVAK
ncbi:MAG: Rieske (2Fe-2S) protein [Planctomycetaceae bacterium]|jgi:menaquinol-cytochrome c reductase iron-sulfur subunit|nr:Rieske (2Fe-2S) protein [Planctomycetaceae bacterium]MBT4012793.1 Rieske (2Fe-2S) protein [Planctomycetaceae bacterium]MBT4725142.1 Rieske (2Fe-2S) protein [Planctomycetaceae bacterium]MBT4846477.1 Rieske (2Fe-2S) protein [Planctomycetaceae bacterium]MBT5124524.1 Rieske (2Fe-2S) protein [Planctomycetaceae bacterium]